MPDLHKLALHTSPGLSIERAERLVHQQHLGVARKHAGDLHPLLHAAGQFAGILVLLATEMHEMKVIAGEGVPALLGHALHPQAKRHVVDGAQPVEKRVIALKHHRAIDSRPPDRPAGEGEHAADRLQEARHQVEDRGLAAAARPEQTEKLSFREAHGKTLQHRYRFHAPASRVPVAYVARHEEFFCH